MDIENARHGLVEELAQRPSLAHVRVRKYGSSLIMHSGTASDEQKHARFSHISASIWGLSFPHHTGRWDKTPFTGSLTELVDILVADFSFFMEQH